MTRSSLKVPVLIIYKRVKSVAFLVAIFLLAAGCRKKAEESLPQKYKIPESEKRYYSRLSDSSEMGKEAEPEKSAVEAGPVVEWTPAENRSWAELPAVHDTWELSFMQGSRVGYGHTQIMSIKTQNGQNVFKIVSTSHLKVQRFGQPLEVVSTIESLESPTGEVIGFVEKMQGLETAQGLDSRVTTAQVAGNQIELTIGKTRKVYAWSANNGGFLAVEHSLMSAPMKPGEHRRLKHLVPMFDTVVTSDLVAKKIEPVKLLHGTYQLLRIDTTITLPDRSKMTGTQWTDSEGQTLKTRSKMFDQETYRVTHEEAMAKYEPAKIDLGFTALVKPDRPLDNPHGAKIGRYVVSLDDADPATVFTSGPSQSVEPIDSRTTRVVVQAIRPEEINTESSDPIDLPSKEDIEPNGYIDSNDPAIRKMAEEIAKGTTSDWQRAVAAEQYVYKLLEKADYSQVFSTASETAKTRRGDCSEHAVLLAAMTRAMGIPSRVVIGLVYSNSLGAFGFHMWNEMYINGAWIPMDSTLGRGGIGAGHLRLGHTNLTNGLADPVFFVIPKTVGKMKIKSEE